jgi:CNT family concentrative nucleoside transporter
MTSGMATIAGTMMVVYASILSGLIPNVMGHSADLQIQAVWA